MSGRPNARTVIDGLPASLREQGPRLRATRWTAARAGLAAWRGVRERGDRFVIGDAAAESSGERLALAPGILRVRAGKIARTEMSWTQAEAWKALRTVEWRLLQGATPVGRVTIRPANGRIVAHGAVKLAAGSKVGHDGKTVTAKLALRLPKALAGKPLSVDVVATDARGRRQVEPAAALINLVK